MRLVSWPITLMVLAIALVSAAGSLAASNNGEQPTKPPVSIVTPGSAVDLDEDLSTSTFRPVNGFTPYTPNAPIITALDHGFDTIGEFMNNGNELIREQERAQKFLADYRKKIELLEKENRQQAEMFARKAEETERAIARLESGHGSPKIDPVASRRPPTTEDQAPPPPAAAQPFQVPNLSGLFSSFAQNQPPPAADSPAQQPLSAPAAAKLDEALPSLANNLENERIVNRDSTIATEELEKLAESKEKDDAKLEAAWKVAGGKGPKPGKSGKQSLREALKAALARKERESGSQSATRELLSLAEKGEENRAPASDPDAVTGSGPLASAAAGAGGGSGFSTSGFGQADLDSGAVSLGGEGAQAQMSRLRNELDEKAAPEVLGRETPDLFQRVRGAHQRSQKNGRLALKS